MELRLEYYMNRFKFRNAHLLSGCGILISVLLLSIFAPVLAPYELNESDLPYLPASEIHLLGTNDMGYDILTELIHAGRISLSIGILAAVISVCLGGGIGIFSGYFRGLSGELFTGIIDIFLLIPMLPLMVVLASYLGQSWWNIALAISILGWCSTARAVRSKVLQLRETLFVEALKGLGISTRRILIYHMVPHIFEIIAAKFVLAVAGAMLSEAALSFIGLGDPSAISWGTMIHYAFTRGGFSGGMWYWYLPPGLCICLCALGFIMIGMHFESMKRKMTPINLMD
jgi:peptide/nickel transport system permease protein